MACLFLLLGSMDVRNKEGDFVDCGVTPYQQTLVGGQVQNICALD
jgi:hypothetical protein